MTVIRIKRNKWHGDHRIRDEWTKQAYAVMATVGSYSVHFGGWSVHHFRLVGNHFLPHFAFFPRVSYSLLAARTSFSVHF
jgi:hypothetical protein